VYYLITPDARYVEVSDWIADADFDTLWKLKNEYREKNSLDLLSRLQDFEKLYLDTSIAISDRPSNISRNTEISQIVGKYVEVVLRRLEEIIKKWDIEPLDPTHNVLKAKAVRFVGQTYTDVVNHDTEERIRFGNELFDTFQAQGYVMGDRAWDPQKVSAEARNRIERLKTEGIPEDLFTDANKCELE